MTILRAHILVKIDEDHAKIRQLLKQILDVAISDKKRKDLYGDLRRELTLHTMLEEESLYSVLKANAPTTQWARIACVQHATQDRLIGRLDKMTVKNPDFLKTLRDLAIEVIGHMKNEEEELAKITKSMTAVPKTNARAPRRQAATSGMPWNHAAAARPHARA